MNDMNKQHMKKQQELMDRIERLLAGDAYSASGAGDDAINGGRDEEIERLLALAAELTAVRPEPTAEFQKRLEMRLAELRAESRSSGSASQEYAKATAAAGDSGKVRWLPEWLTMPRVVAVTAALVVGLGLVGMTGALIRGGYKSRTTADTNAVSQGVTTDADSRTMEKAAGSPEPGLADEIAAEDVTGFTAPDGSGNNSASAASMVPPLTTTQRIIQTADYRIEIVPGEFDEKYAQISDIAVKYGGYVVSGDSRRGNDELKSGSVTIRVANTGDNFTRAQADVDSLGNVTSKKISGQDVTEEYVDLESRLRNAEAQEAQYLALMQRAQTIDEILMVQSRLADVQSQIEQIKGRMNYMEGRTDFATITIALRESGSDEAPEDDGGIDWGFVDSIEYAGWLAVQTLNFVIVALGVIVPLTVMVGGLALIVYRISQKRRSKKDDERQPSS